MTIKTNLTIILILVSLILGLNSSYLLSQHILKTFIDPIHYIYTLTVFTLIIIIIAHSLFKGILYSVNKLREGTEIIGTGNLEYSIDVRSHDEFGQLATAFNKMTENLNTVTVSRNYVDNIMQSMNDSLIVISTDFRVQTVNRATCLLLRYRDYELIGKPIVNMFSNESSHDMVNFNDIIEKGFVRNIESTYISKDGMEIPVIFSGSVMRDTSNSVQGIVCVALDITERKKSQDLQKRLIQELESANQELKDFAYIVSHDLKAPLRGIVSLANWIATDYSDKIDNEGNEQINLLTGRVKRMQSLIDGILRYSRVGRIKEESVSVDLNEAVTEVINMIAPPENFDIKIENTLPTIVCERTRIQQVFQNLIGNAIKYMDKPKGEIMIGCEQENGFWKFMVSDNGPGIEEKYYDKIFQIFQTLQSRDEFESTGIGLSIVKKIAKMYGGDVWIESEVGKGTIFFFTLSKDNVS